jgi:hypothetical protein
MEVSIQRVERQQYGAGTMKLQGYPQAAQGLVGEPCCGAMA